VKEGRGEISSQRRRKREGKKVARLTSRNVRQLRGERSSTGSISELDLGRLHSVVDFSELVGDGSEIELNRQRERRRCSLSSSFLSSFATPVRKEGRKKTHPLHRVLPPSNLLSLKSLLLSSDELRVDISDRRGNGRRRLVESRGDVDLLLVDLLDPLVLLELADGLEIVHASVKKSDSDVSLLERSDVVRSVSSHESGVAEVLERGKDELLLRRRDSSVDPGVLNEIEPRREVFVLLQGDSGDADVVVGEDLLVEGGGRVDGDDDGFIDGSPNEIWEEPKGEDESERTRRDVFGSREEVSNSPVSEV